MKKSVPKQQDDFAEFFGTWSQSDLQEFNDATRDFSIVDKIDHIASTIQTNHTSCPSPA